MGAVGDCRRLEQTLGAALSVGGGRMVAGTVHASGGGAAGLREVAERAATRALGEGLAGDELFDMTVLPQEQEFRRLVERRLDRPSHVDEVNRQR